MAPEKQRSRGDYPGSTTTKIYTYDLSNTTARKYAHADDLVIMHTVCSRQEAEEVLNQDMARLSDYSRKWRLKLRGKKTVSASFHLNNKEAKHELNIKINTSRLAHQEIPTYFWCEAGQDAHILPTLRKLVHEIDITHCTLEALCWY